MADTKREKIKSKYEQVADTLYTGIRRNIYPNGKLPREIDIAKQMRVSRGTVGIAMKLLVGKGLIERTKRKGTQVVGGGQKMTTNCQVGIIMNSEGHFYSILYQAVVGCLSDNGLYPVHVNNKPVAGFDAEACEARIGMLLRSPLRGILIEGDSYWRSPFLERYPHPEAVFINSYDGRGEIPGRAVLADNEMAASLATKHLIALGHKRILLFINIHRHLSFDDASYWKNNSCFQYEQGYLRAMKAKNLNGMAEIMQLPIDKKINADTIRGVLARPKRPTAIICMMDYYAVKVVITALSMGIRIPEELAVIGMYNTPWCVESPVLLTSVSFEERRMAGEAVAMIVSGAKDRKIIKIKPKLVVRDSCGSGKKSSNENENKSGTEETSVNKIWQEHAI